MMAKSVTVEIDLSVTEDELISFIGDWEDIADKLRELAKIERAVIKMADIKEIELEA